MASKLIFFFISRQILPNFSYPSTLAETIRMPHWGHTEMRTSKNQLPIRGVVRSEPQGRRSIKLE
jgi:hypothetical protein